MASNPYDLMAPAYDQESHSAVATGLADVLTEATCGEAPSRVLDIGCGTGILAHRLSRSGATIVGVDRSTGMLARARARLNGRAAARLIRGDMTKLPFAPEFDAVVASNEVLNQVPGETLPTLLVQMRRVLRVGGWLCFDALHADHFSRYWDDRHWEEEQDHERLWMDCEWIPAEGYGVARCAAVVTHGGRTRIRTGLLTEYLHDLATLEGALHAACFTVVSRTPWNPYPEPQPEGFIDRSIWLARRA
jgi:ubiquinone/menaquinone biosynthesis C-methylase UbiE